MKLIRQMVNAEIDRGLIKLEIYWEGKITQEFTPQDVIISSHSFRILSNQQIRLQDYVIMSVP